jgi:hypothetical protein
VVDTGGDPTSGGGSSSMSAKRSASRSSKSLLAPIVSFGHKRRWPQRAHAASPAPEGEDGAGAEGAPQAHARCKWTGVAVTPRSPRPMPTSNARSAGAPARLGAVREL